MEYMILHKKSLHLPGPGDAVECKECGKELSCKSTYDSHLKKTHKIRLT